MAITDINISEELQTGAPSIKYEGNEGPQDPRKEQMIARLKQEYMQYAMEQQELGQPIMPFQEWYQMVYEASKMGVQAPQEQITAEETMTREPAAFGGIMDRYNRRRYGLGSSLKKRIRKLIPNEAAKVATVAAPFVAPFNPLIAGAMAGIGGFDQHGSLSRGLKSGLMTYGMGNVARWAGGAGPQWGLKAPGAGTGFGSYFTTPTGTETGIGKWLSERKGTPGVNIDKGRGSEIDTLYRSGEGANPNIRVAPSGDTYALNDPTWNEKVDFTKQLTKATGQKGENIIQGENSVLQSIKEAMLDNKAMLGILGLSAAAGAYTAATEVDEVVGEMDRGVPLKIREIREEVIEAFKDPTGKKLEAIRIKYPFLGAKETKNIDIMAQGGRAGLYSGGLSIPSEYTMEDARKTAMQDRLGGITDVMKRADLYRQGDIGQMYMAQGGRIRAQEGGLMDLGGMEKDYRQEGGFVPIGGQEKADDVPARLSKNEFVFTADAVRNAGGGDIDKGAQIMENVMKNLEAGGKMSEESQGEGAQEMFEVSERLSEVI